MEIGNRVALVSGGASGLGQATARRLLAAGARVVIGDRDQVRGAALADELGASARFVAMDVTKIETVQAAVAAALDFGDFRIAVNCAGVGWAQRTVGKNNVPHDAASFRTVIEINLIGSFHVLSLSAAAMAELDLSSEGERGVIVNTASVAAFDGQIGQLAYSASKAAIAGMTLPAARDLARQGVRVMTIAPGIFDTPLLGQLPDSVKQTLSELVPFPARLGNPDEYARLVCAIVENTYLNGEVIRLDGALRMPPK
ncbi:MAG: SDR family NAD(P)-dependent oxidoreductase [Myxococcales bacterium]|nr:SDR family NAD(P)-dependent oxidoreductase [Myxococcales bacterium]